MRWRWEPLRGAALLGCWRAPLGARLARRTISCTLGRRAALPSAFAPRACSARGRRLTPAAARFGVSARLLGLHKQDSQAPFVSLGKQQRRGMPSSGGIRTVPAGRRARPPVGTRGGSSPLPRLLESARFFSSGGQLVSQMRALRCQGGFVTAPRAGPAALSCPPPPREPIVPGPSGGCWRQIYRGRRPAGRGLRSAAGRGAGGSAPGTFDPSCCHRRGRRGPRGRIPLGICFARPVRGRLLFFS